jgi:elongator complex protein 2
LSTTEENAVIRLYSSESKWKECVATLSSHSLTVTQLQFSMNDDYLLSVSRDRNVSVFKKSPSPCFFSLCFKKKAHSRIIWDCAWSFDDSFFVTASRDKTVFTV